MREPSIRSDRSRAPLVALLGVALLVGIVASLLVGAAPPPPRAQAGELVVDLPPTVWGFLCLSPLIAGLVVIVARRLTEGAAKMRRTLVGAAVALVIALLFIYLVHGGGSLGQGTVTVTTGPNPVNTTQPAKTNPPTPPANGTSVPGTYIVTIQSWTLAALVAGVSVCVAALALPGMLSRVLDRRPRKAPGPPTARVQVQAALADAAAAIDRGEDPRGTVIRLYLRLLHEIAPRIGDVSPLTPDEIRQFTLSVLGVGAAASEALTRLFEEARYSTHPIGPEEARRFREAIRQVDEDLRRDYQPPRSVAS
jgi:hypothetical protein